MLGTQQRLADGAGPSLRSRPVHARAACPGTGCGHCSLARGDIVWTYTDPSRASLWSPLISNPQRLPNGNTLINEGLFGRLFEITPLGETVWEYVNPYFGPGNAPLAAQTNSVFRAYRYTADQVDRARAA